MPRQFYLVMQQDVPRGQRIADIETLQDMFSYGDPSLTVRNVYFPTLSQVQEAIRQWARPSNGQILGVHIEMISPTQWNILGYNQYVRPFAIVSYTTPIPFNPTNINFFGTSMLEISNEVAVWDENMIADAQRADTEYFRAHAEMDAELGIVNNIVQVQPHHRDVAQARMNAERGLINNVVQVQPPLRVGAQVLNNAQMLNQAQSTHTASVHQSVTQSLKNLDNEYGKKLDIDKQIKSLQEFIKKINRNEFPNIPEYQLDSAIRCLIRMNKLYDEIEAGSNFTIKKILALIWVAMHDVKNTKDAEEAFIKALYEIQRGYNLNAKGVDDMETQDHPICTGGTINKLVASQNGVHKSVVIAFVTAQSAGFKVMGITSDCIFEYASQSENPEKTLVDIFATVEKNGGIPDELWNQIKDNVAVKMHDEFGGFLQKNTIDNITSQGEFTNFDKGQQQRMIQKLKLVLQNNKNYTLPTGQSIADNKITDLAPRIQFLFRKELTNKEQLNILIDIEKHGDPKEKNQVTLFWDSTQTRKVSKQQFEDYKIILKTFLKSVYDIVKNEIKNEPESFKLFRNYLQNDKLSLNEKLFELKKIASEPANLSIINNTLHNKNLCSIIKNVDLLTNKEKLTHEINQLKSIKREYHSHNLIQYNFISQHRSLNK